MIFFSKKKKKKKSTDLAIANIHEALTKTDSRAELKRTVEKVAPNLEQIGPNTEAVIEEKFEFLEGVVKQTLQILQENVSYLDKIINNVLSKKYDQKNIFFLKKKKSLEFISCYF